VPIIALTANIMSNDLEVYKTNGMTDYLGKPFTSQELWKCLTKYLPVVSYTAVDSEQQNSEDSKTRKQLQVYFAKNNQTTFASIEQAIEADDIKTAHRLVHTLKSNSGQIGESRLQEIAAEVEEMLSGGKNRLDRDRASSLEAELNSVLKKLAPLLSEAEERGKTEDADIGKAWEIIAELEPMLMNHKPGCMEMLDDIRTIPGSEALASHVENLEFKNAIDELNRLKERLERRLKAHLPT